MTTCNRFLLTIQSELGLSWLTRLVLPSLTDRCLGLVMSLEHRSISWCLCCPSRQGLWESLPWRGSCYLPQSRGVVNEQKRGERDRRKREMLIWVNNTVACWNPIQMKLERSWISVAVVLGCCRMALSWVCSRTRCPGLLCEGVKEQLVNQTVDFGSQRSLFT